MTADNKAVAKKVASILAARMAEVDARKLRHAKEAAQGDLYLPDCGEHWRLLPNEIARSGLFNVRNKASPRVHRNNYAIVVIGDGEIRYTGEELRQDDAQVWMQLVHMARHQPIGEPLHFTAYAFCKALGWGVSAPSYEHLRTCLTRMQATSVAIFSKRLRQGVSVSMVPEFRWQDEFTQKPLPRYQVRLATPFAALFSDPAITRLQWEHVKMLPQGFASWLYGYICSHKSPYPILLTTLAAATQAQSESKRWRQTVQRGAEALKKAGLIADWRIEDEKLIIER